MKKDKMINSAGPAFYTIKKNKKKNIKNVNVRDWNRTDYWVWCLTPLSTNFSGVSFIGGVKRRAHRIPRTCMCFAFSPLPLKSSLCQIIVIFNIFSHIYYNEINLIIGIQYFMPVEIDLSVVPARLGIWIFHLSRRTTVIQDLLVQQTRKNYRI
jgi:hypothetical protein